MSPFRTFANKVERDRSRTSVPPETVGTESNVPEDLVSIINTRDYVIQKMTQMHVPSSILHLRIPTV